jgi:Fe2+ or Zn2+ uptake regulation protein
MCPLYQGHSIYRVLDTFVRATEVRNASIPLAAIHGGEIMCNHIDIYICLNCGHLEHYHIDKQTGEITDTCRKPDCDCQSYSPEIAN